MSCKAIVIGTGELGSRHLQGLIGSLENLDIICIDHSESALLKAQKRLEEIKEPYTHTVRFTNTYSDLPTQTNLVIISTNSRERRQVIETLSENTRIKYLVLEKVLFPKVEDY